MEYKYTKVNNEKFMRLAKKHALDGKANFESKLPWSGLIELLLIMNLSRYAIIIYIVIKINGSVCVSVCVSVD